jgi:hypothetical protein
MKWFRWYRGTAERARFRVIADRASHSGMGGGSVHEDRVDGAVFHTDVLSVWVALLEDAGNALHWGYVTRDARYIATLLDLGTPEVEAILLGMVEEEMIEPIGSDRYHVVNWEKYQYISDTDPTNSERQKRYRMKRVSNALVTGTDTDTDTEKKEEGASAPEKYAFKGKIIKLTKDDFSLWKASFSNLDLTAELVARDAFLADLPETERRNWFVSTAAMLRNRNQIAPKANGSVKYHVPGGVLPGGRLDFKSELKPMPEITEEQRKANLRKLEAVLKLKRA